MNYDFMLKLNFFFVFDRLKFFWGVNNIVKYLLLVESFENELNFC